MTPRLTAGLDFHTQALVLRAERQRVIASNIANADTPGYQARDVDFAAALRNATASGAAGNGNGAGGAGGAGGPIGSGIAQDVMASAGAATPTLQSALRYAVPSQTNLDNNSVDMDRERSAFAENAVKYESTLRFINASVRTTLDAMKSFHQA